MLQLNTSAWCRLHKAKILLTFSGISSTFWKGIAYRNHFGSFDKSEYIA
jgi:hypothetical protein